MRRFMALSLAVMLLLSGCSSSKTSNTDHEWEETKSQMEKLENLIESKVPYEYRKGNAYVLNVDLPSKVYKDENGIEDGCFSISVSLDMPEVDVELAKELSKSIYEDTVGDLSYPVYLYTFWYIYDYTYFARVERFTDEESYTLIVYNEDMTEGEPTTFS